MQRRITTKKPEHRLLPCPHIRTTDRAHGTRRCLGPAAPHGGDRVSLSLPSAEPTASLTCALSLRQDTASSVAASGSSGSGSDKGRRGGQARGGSSQNNMAQFWHGGRAWLRPGVRGGRLGTCYLRRQLAPTRHPSCRAYR
ncbi:hypothetical protein O3P69_013785 [Scylla paramamosain]|uniref:Uncharacterized protein n=1 Tax=Scylla paramamosain TaxID=85552 RepID=A0AAW0SRR5_SCYPA